MQVINGTLIVKYGSITLKENEGYYYLTNGTKTITLSAMPNLDPKNLQKLLQSNNNGDLVVLPTTTSPYFSIPKPKVCNSFQINAFAKIAQKAADYFDYQQNQYAYGY